MSKGLGFWAAPAVALGGAVLDAYTASMWGLWGIRRYLTVYTGNLIRVRRNSDNAEQDIPQNPDGSLNTVNLLAFVGSGNGYITTAYDQSGLGHDLVQTTAGKQPRIVNAGTYDGKYVFDGVDDSLVSPNHGTPSGVSIHARLMINSTADQIIAFSDAGNVAAGSMVWDYQASTNGHRNIEATQAGSNLVFGTFTGISLAEGVDSFVSDYTQGTSAARVPFYRNGVAASGSFTTAGTIATSVVMGAVPWNIGARADSTGPCSMYVKGLVIYEAPQNASTVAAIAAIL
jgi:hypothetical protein